VVLSRGVQYEVLYITVTGLAWVNRLSGVVATCVVIFRMYQGLEMSTIVGRIKTRQLSLIDTFNDNNSTLKPHVERSTYHISTTKIDVSPGIIQLV
jgi:hypothetical protein